MGESRASKARNSLSLPRMAAAVPLEEDNKQGGSPVSCRWTFDGILVKQTRTRGFRFVPCRFEETDPNLETRASGEAGVDPPHYVGVA